MCNISSKIKKIASLLKKIDIFAVKTQLKMNRRTRFSTVLGGFFSLLMIGLSLLLFLHFGNDMINHENPMSLTSEIYVLNPMKTHFSTQQNFLMFGVQFPNYSHFIDDTVYKMTVKNRKIGRDSNDSFNLDVPVVRCTKEILPSEPEMHEYFTKASGSPIKAVFCIQDIGKYFLEGSFDRSNYAYMQLIVKKCVNKTDDPTS